MTPEPAMPDIKIIYNAGYVRPLGICQSGEGFKGWLMYQHHDGQWVSLVRPETILAAIPSDLATARESALIDALIYARRFLNGEDHDVVYLDSVITEAQVRAGRKA